MGAARGDARGGYAVLGDARLRRGGEVHCGTDGAKAVRFHPHRRKRHLAERENPLVGVDFLDCDGDPGGIEPDLSARQQGRFNCAGVIAAVMEELFPVGPDDQVMADGRKAEVFAKLPRPVGGAGASSLSDLTRRGIVR